MSLVCQVAVPDNVTQFPGTGEAVTKLAPLPPCDLEYHAIDASEAKKAKKKEVCELVSVDEINRLVSYFLDHDQVRDALIVIVQCNTGLRISDTLCLRWKDIVRDEFSLTTQKTGTDVQVYPNQAIHEAAALYRVTSERPCNPDDYVFVSSSGRSGHVPLLDRRKRVVDKQHTVDIQPLRAETVSRIMTKAGKESGLATKNRRISSHTGRKTHANALTGTVAGFELGKDLEKQQSQIYLAQCALGHAKADTTTNHYLNNVVYQEACRRMNFGLQPIQEYIKRKGIIV